jgi:hypothetical protein
MLLYGIYVVLYEPPLWSSGPGFHFRLYKIFWEVVGLERGPPNLL